MLQLSVNNKCCGVCAEVQSMNSTFQKYHIMRKNVVFEQNTTSSMMKWS